MAHPYLSSLVVELRMIKQRVEEAMKVIHVCCL